MNLKRKYPGTDHLKDEINTTNKKIRILNDNLNTNIDKMMEQISIEDEHKTFENICEDGNTQLIELILQNRNVLDDIEDGFIKVCQFGHIEAANLFIRIGISINVGLESACVSRHIKMIQFLIPKYFGLSWKDEFAHAFDIEFNPEFKHLMITVDVKKNQIILNDLWNVGLYYAFKTNNRGLIELMLVHSDKDDYGSSYTSMNGLCVIGACEGKHKFFTTFYFDRKNIQVRSKIDVALLYASSRGRIDWLKCIRETFFHQIDNIDYLDLIEAALEKGHENTVKYLSENFLDNSEESFYYCRNLINSSCQSGNYDLWKYIVNKLIVCRNTLILNEYLPKSSSFHNNDDDKSLILLDYIGNQLDDLYSTMIYYHLDNPKSKYSYSKLLEISCIGGNLAIVKEILQLGSYDINNINFAKFQNVEIVLYLISHHHAKIKDWSGILSFMCETGSIEILDLLIHLKIDLLEAYYIPDACQRGQVELVKAMIQKSNNTNMENHFRRILDAICKINNFELLKTMYDKWGKSLIPCMNGNLEIDCILIACNNNKIEFANTLIQNGYLIKYETYRKNKYPPNYLWLFQSHNNKHKYDYPNDLREIIYLMNHDAITLDKLESKIQNLDNFRDALKLRKFNVIVILEEYISPEVLVEIISNYFEY